MEKQTDTMEMRLSRLERQLVTIETCEPDEASSHKQADAIRARLEQEIGEIESTVRALEAQLEEPA